MLEWYYRHVLLTTSYPVLFLNPLPLISNSRSPRMLSFMKASIISEDSLGGGGDGGGGGEGGGGDGGDTLPPVITSPDRCLSAASGGETGDGRWNTGRLSLCCRSFAVPIMKTMETRAKMKTAITSFSAWTILRLVVMGGTPFTIFVNSRATKCRKG